MHENSRTRPTSRSSALRALIRGIAGVLFVFPSAYAQLAPEERVPPAERAPYRALVNATRTFTNFNVEAVRGFVFTPSESVIHALNVDESTVLRFAWPSGTVTARWRTLNNPVSIARRGASVFVLGQGTHALARHDASSGAIVDLLVLPSEPADLIVDELGGRAWVSCMGADSVLELDLEPRLVVTHTWDASSGLLVKRPRFLHHDPRDPAVLGDDVVYVAPMISGNNTLITSRLHELVPGTPNPLNGRILDGGDLSVFPNGGLPDVDLWRIPCDGTAHAEPVVRGAGSLVLAHGLQPTTGDLWMLAVDEDNLVGVTEAGVRGVFARHMLSIVDSTSLPDSGAPPALPTSRVDLDDATPAALEPTYSSDTALAFPYALAFHPDGRAAIASSTSNRIAITDAAGQRVRQLDFDATELGIRGRVPRTLEFIGDRLVAYCQQSNELLVWDLAAQVARPIARMSLGNDPAPSVIKRGRAVWYDSSRSLHGRTSCNTCHPGGGTDGLVWDLSESPLDTKGPMVTQTLLGLEDSFPHHWRGERGLFDFAAAFEGLLGSTGPIHIDDMTHLAYFMFSLTPHANPRADLDRVLSDRTGLRLQGANHGVRPRLGSPVRGDRVFHEVESGAPAGVGGSSACIACHASPTGSGGSDFPIAPDPVATRAALEIVQLDTQLPFKDQPMVFVEVDPALAGVAKLQSQLLGSGVTHDGSVLDLFTYVAETFPGLTEEDAADVTTFLGVFDTGTAPMTHHAARIDASVPRAEAKRIVQRFLDQARRGWIGVVAHGRFELAGGASEPMGWTYRASDDRFLPEDRQRASPKSAAEFLQSAREGRGEFVLFGVPHGNERRLGVDLDEDGLDTGEEIAAGTDPWSPDSDSDGLEDGYELAQGSDPSDAASRPVDTVPPALVGPIEIVYTSSTVSMFRFTTNEPTRWAIVLSTPGGRTIEQGRRAIDWHHTAVVSGFEPSTENRPPNVFSGTLKLTDVLGNEAYFPLPSFESKLLARAHDAAGNPTTTYIVDELVLQDEVRQRATYSARLHVRVGAREGGPPASPVAGAVLVGQILVRVPGALDWSVLPFPDLEHDGPHAGPTFELGGRAYNVQNGGLRPPFVLLAPTGADGRSQVQFTARNLAPGVEVRFNVITILPAPAGYDPARPAFMETHQWRYSMPSTPARLRGVASSI